MQAIKILSSNNSKNITLFSSTSSSFKFTSTIKQILSKVECETLKPEWNQNVILFYIWNKFNRIKIFSVKKSNKNL